MSGMQFEDNIPWTFLGFGLGVVCFTLFLFRKRRTGLPGSGISRLPCFHLPGLERLRKLRDLYGEIFSVYIGAKTVIFVNGYETIKDALRSDLLAAKPSVFVSEPASKYKRVVTSSGTDWLHEKELVMAGLNEFREGSGRNVFEIKIADEVDYLLKLIDDELKRTVFVDMTYFIEFAATNIVCSTLLGKHFDEDDPVFIEYLKRRRETFKEAEILTFLPFLRHVPGDMFRLKRIRENDIFTEGEIIGPCIERCKTEPNYANRPTNFTSAYFKLLRAKDKGEEEEGNLVNILKNLINCGASSVATTLGKGILLLSEHKIVQDRIFEEIRVQGGVHHRPSFTDRSGLPYTRAAIAEIQRLSNVHPYGIWQSVDRDVSFKGNTIPRGSLLCPVLDSVLTDPNIWKNQECFEPERFLDDLGQFRDRDEWIPFSVGEGMCPGRQLAEMELFLSLTSLVQRYRFHVPKSKRLSSIYAQEPCPEHLAHIHIMKRQSVRHCRNLAEL